MAYGRPGNFPPKDNGPLNGPKLLHDNNTSPYGEIVTSKNFYDYEALEKGGAVISSGSITGETSADKKERKIQEEKNKELINRTFQALLDQIDSFRLDLSKLKIDLATINAQIAATQQNIQQLTAQQQAAVAAQSEQNIVVTEKENILQQAQTAVNNAQQAFDSAKITLAEGSKQKIPHNYVTYNTEFLGMSYIVFKDENKNYYYHDKEGKKVEITDQQTIDRIKKDEQEGKITASEGDQTPPKIQAINQQNEEKFSAANKARIELEKAKENLEKAKTEYEQAVEKKKVLDTAKEKIDTELKAEQEKLEKLKNERKPELEKQIADLEKRIAEKTAEAERILAEEKNLSPELKAKAEKLLSEINNTNTATSNYSRAAQELEQAKKLQNQFLQDRDKSLNTYKAETPKNFVTADAGGNNTSDAYGMKKIVFTKESEKDRYYITGYDGQDIELTNARIIEDIKKQQAAGKAIVSENDPERLKREIQYSEFQQKHIDTMNAVKDTGRAQVNVNRLSNQQTTFEPEAPIETKPKTLALFSGIGAAIESGETQIAEVSPETPVIKGQYTTLSSEFARSADEETAKRPSLTSAFKTSAENTLATESAPVAGATQIFQEKMTIKGFNV